MRVTRVRAFRQLQPFRRGTYAMGHVGSPAFESLIVALDTDEGVTGWGEMAVISPAYTESFAAGAQAGVAELAPLLLGVDPTQPRAVLALLDGAMRGQPYVKSALDMACWDADSAGRRTSALRDARRASRRRRTALQRRHDLVRRRRGRPRARARWPTGTGACRSRSAPSPKPTPSGSRRCARPSATTVVLFADANGGFTTGGARRFLRATRDLEYVLEQPCRTYAECASVRRHCDRPLVLDESIVTLDDLLRAHREGVADGITVKLQRVGGITRAALDPRRRGRARARGDRRGRRRREPRHRRRRARRARHAGATAGAHLRLPHLGLGRPRHGTAAPRRGSAGAAARARPRDRRRRRRRSASPCSTWRTGSAEGAGRARVG